MRNVSETIDEIVKQFELLSKGESIKERQTLTGVKDTELAFWTNILNTNFDINDPASTDPKTLRDEALKICNKLLTIKGIIRQISIKNY